MAINRKIQTLDEFTIQQMRNFPNATGELSGLLRDIGLAAKRINVEVNKAGLVDILGDAGTTNVQGEEVKKLDVCANEQFVGVLTVESARSDGPFVGVNARHVHPRHHAQCFGNAGGTDAAKILLREHRDGRR